MRKILVLLVLSALISACGGSSGGHSTAPEKTNTGVDANNSTEVSSTWDSVTWDNGKWK